MTSNQFAVVFVCTVVGHIEQHLQWSKHIPGNAKYH